MKKNTFLLLICMVSIAVVSLMAYKMNNRILDSAALHIANINLENFQYRGMMQAPKTHADAALEMQAAIQTVDALFETKPLEALARYQQLLEQDAGHLGLRLRLGMLQLKLHQRAVAKENLHFVYAHKEAGLQPDAAWFLALLAIEEQMPDKANQFLQESIDSGCSYLEEAKQLFALF